jgi:hypothetical protein
VNINVKKTSSSYSTFNCKALALVILHLIGRHVAPSTWSFDRLALAKSILLLYDPIIFFVVLRLAFLLFLRCGLFGALPWCPLFSLAPYCLLSLHFFQAFNCLAGRKVSDTSKTAVGFRLVLVILLTEILAKIANSIKLPPIVATLSDPPSNDFLSLCSSQGTVCLFLWYPSSGGIVWTLRRFLDTPPSCPFLRKPFDEQVSILRFVFVR